MFMEMIMQKDKVSPRKFYAEGADSVSSEPPSIFFVFPPLFGLCSCLPDSRSAVYG